MSEIDGSRISKITFTFLNIGAIATDAEFHRDRISFLTKDVDKRVIEATNVSKLALGCSRKVVVRNRPEAILVFWMLQEQVFRRIRLVGPVRFNLGVLMSRNT